MLYGEMVVYGKADHWISVSSSENDERSAILSSLTRRIAKLAGSLAMLKWATLSRYRKVEIQEKKKIKNLKRQKHKEERKKRKIPGIGERSYSWEINWAQRG